MRKQGYNLSRQLNWRCFYLGIFYVFLEWLGYDPEIGRGVSNLCASVYWRCFQKRVKVERRVGCFMILLVDFSYNVVGVRLTNDAYHYIHL